MKSIRIDYLLKYLKSYAIENDKTIFNKWEKGLITTDECISLFRIHNDVNERMPIIRDEFVEWLNSLGYKRYEEKRRSKN